LPECLDDWVDESNPVRAVDVFVETLDLRGLGFEGVVPAATGRPAYHPSPMLKLYIYGYVNRVQSSRRLEREAGRNLEVMWLTGRLVPDHKTIADFRKDNGPAIKKVCAQFGALCRKLGLLAKASVAIDGSKFKAVNSRGNNFTKGKIDRRLARIEDVFCFRGSLALDACCLDDRPPLFDLGLVVGAKRLGRLLLARENLLCEIGEPCPHVRIGQGVHGRGIELGDDVLRRRLGRP
jgi:transposase